MDHQRLLDLEEKCIQDFPPACVATCPVHVDARSFAAAINSGDFTRAMEIYSKTVPFPGIIGRVCEHPCQAACKRREAGEAISLAALEKYCVQMSPTSRAKISVRPKKDQRVAVVGAGLSGLTAAFDLAVRGYDVVLFEAKDRLGGSLRDFAEEVLPRAVIAEDTAVLADLGVELKLDAAVGKTFSLTDLRGDFAAVYLGLGKNPQDTLGLELDPEGRININPDTYGTNLAGVFAAGSMFTGRDYLPIASLAGGRRAAISIDRYLQGVSLTAMRENEGPYQTRLYTSLEGIEPVP
ncbi:MAG: FAD-dependent oxidoreductase, partial [Oscillospiraceae bacterium]|nr:FAD-dependent oxidoreductase [Oscillospiraceae bacterium]